MAVTGITVLSRRPFEDGKPFGETGPYERVDAILHFAVDPACDLNRGIVDLECARRGADGLVHFESDLVVLRPASRGRVDGRLLCSVVNRGRIALLPFSFPPAGMVLASNDRIEPGDGLLLRRGWVVALCGWQWDVIRRPGALGLVAPLALDAAGQPASTVVTVRFQPLTDRASQHLSHWPAHPTPGPDRVHHAYPAANLDDETAVLSVRTTPDAPPAVVPRAQWRFARLEPPGPLVPDPESVTLDGGFQAGLIYELTYTTNRCPVAGTGLLAIRDTASFLRHGDRISGNPCAGDVTHVFAHGASQTGRFLREFLHGGFNIDEAGRQALDGVFVQIAGARRGEFNFRGAQPSAQYVVGPGHRPPFTYTPTSTETAALDDAQRARGGLPRVFEVNTANEYWRSNAALVHTDPEAGRDLDLPSHVRVYALAGCQHGPGPPALMRFSPVTPEQRTANAICMLNSTPLVRAALINLEQWTAEGVEPPPSCVPRIEAGELTTRDSVLARMQAIPGASLPKPALLPRLGRFDGSGAFADLVSEIDDDFNEAAGIRLPEVAVPLGTHTGWNPRAPENGGEDQLADMLGSTIPFAATVSTRERAGDPRRSIEERYGSRDDYCARVREEAIRLVEARLVLAEDVDRLVRGAGRVYERLVARRA